MIPERLMPGTEEWETFEAEHRQRYDFAARYCRGLRVLDIACGVGYGSQMLAQSGAASVTGVDISEETVEYARRHFAHPKLEFAACDAENLAMLGMQFDAAVSFETLEHLAEPEKLLSRVHEALAPGGVFICSTPNRDYARKGAANPYHLCEWSYDEFHSAFAAHFEVEGVFHQSPTPAYLRHLTLLSELEAVQKKLRFSLAFRAEEKLRKALGKPALNGHAMNPAASRILPGDYMIEAIQAPLSTHVTFILAGRKAA